MSCNAPVARLGIHLFRRTFAALTVTEVEAKLAAVRSLYADFCADRDAGLLHVVDDHEPVVALPRAGQPERPVLVPPEQVPFRAVGSKEGKAALLHAVAHIEFSAINLALDAVYRFRGLPAEYYEGWLKVAWEEVDHFERIRACLHRDGFDYGDFPAHNGLWQLAVKTADDPLARMALIPRLMEARGLDVTPPIIGKFRSVGDKQAVAALDVILREEVGHVALGDHWFRQLCAERGLEAEATYRALLADERYGAPRVKGPFNRKARLEAGFGETELQALETLAAG